MPDARKYSPLRLGVLISGSGSTLANLIERIADGRLRGVQIVTVISSRAGVRGVEIARGAGLEVHVVRPGEYAGEAEFGEAIASLLDAAHADLVAMAGFLHLWRFPRRYEARVLNIHPALLPDFGGAGMYGLRVHEAVLAAGATDSGCTVHLADYEYDHGPIVALRRVPVLAGDTPALLAERVQRAERELYPDVLQEVADRGLEWLRAYANS